MNGECDGWDTFSAVKHINETEFRLLDTCIQENYFNNNHSLSLNVLRGC